MSASLRASIYLSFMAHLLILVLTPARPPQTDSQQQPIRFQIVESLPKKQESDKQQKGQIVEQNLAPSENSPENSRFLSRHNQRVEKETRAPLAGAFNNEGGTPTQQPEEKPWKPKAQLTSQDLLPSGLMAQPRPARKPTSLNKGPRKQGRPGQLSRTRDHLAGIALGKETLLNTKEFVYYSYYHRIRQQISQYWEPRIREYLRFLWEQDKSLGAVPEWNTQIAIVLNKKGELKAIEVVRTSGLDVLDNAAREAFQKASPFPNPPDGIVDADGNIRIRWDFVIST